MFYTVGYPSVAVGDFWYHPSPLWACSATGTYAVWLGWRLWLVHEGPPYQLNHGQVDKQVLVLRLHHGRTLLAHFLNNAVHTEVLGNSLGQRSEVRMKHFTVVFVFLQHLVVLTNQIGSLISSIKINLSLIWFIKSVHLLCSNSWCLPPDDAR